MIPFDYIVEWRKSAPWAADSQVEQDLVIHRALVCLFGEPEVARSMAFRGGTALYKLHLRPPARFSEDIDLVQTSPGPIGTVLDSIRRSLDPWLGAPKRDLKEGRVVLIYRFLSEDRHPLPLRLKVEINSREHFSVLGFEERPLDMESRWFNGSASVRTYRLEELLGTKLRALYQRKKGRDLFDLHMASCRSAVDPAAMVHCLLRYLEHDERSISRAEFEENLAEKLVDKVFMGDVAPLVAPGFEWSMEDAARYVLEEVVPLMPGEPWKGRE